MTAYVWPTGKSVDEISHEVPICIHINAKVDYLSALLDNGSPACFVREKELTKLTNKPKSILQPWVSQLKYGNPDGRPFNILGCIHTYISLKLNPHTRVPTTLVVVKDNLPYPVILGRDFLASAGIGLYYKPGTEAVCTTISVGTTPVTPDDFYKWPEELKPIFAVNTVDGESSDAINSDSNTIMAYEEPDVEAMEMDNDPNKLKDFDPRVRDILLKFPAAIASELSSVPCSEAEHTIELINGSKPYKRSYYRIGPDERKFIDEEVAKLLKLGIIAPSRSPWGSPIVLVRKKEGTFRMCIDYRKLNEYTIGDVHPLPFLEDIFDKLSGMKVFSKIDMKSGYWQVLLSANSRSMTAFMSHKGLFEWLRMPFGLKNATSTFQRLMRKVLSGLEHCTEVHVDDIIIFSKTEQDHLEHVRLVMERIAEAHLIINLPKSKFMQQTLPFLGHVFSAAGVRPDPDKTRAMSELRSPRDLTQARSFLGAANYYRRFVRHFSELVHPIVELTKKGVDFHWGEAQQYAFDTVKTALTSEPVLVHPDFSKRFTVTADACDYAVSGMLSQEYDGMSRPVTYYSRALSGAQLNYATVEKECLAIIECVKQWRHYLSHAPFLIETDHKPLEWLKSLDGPTRRQTRWSILLQEYEYAIVHKAGKLNVVADCLNRCCAVDIREPEIDFEDHLMRYVLTRTHPSGASLAQCRRIERKALELTYENGIIRHKGRPVPTKDERVSIIERCHLMGHAGIAATAVRVLDEHWWPSVYDDVKREISKCSRCAEYNDDVGPKMVPRTHRVSYPKGAFDLVSMDLFGPLSTSENGNRYGMVVNDHLTKWVEIIAIPNKTEETVALALWNQVYCRYGPPTQILSDQGGEFLNKVIEKMNKLSDVIAKTTSGYHPQTNGLTEKTNHIIAQALRKFSHGERKNWDLWLPFIQLCENSRVHKATGQTPMYLMFGREHLLFKDFRGQNTVVDDSDISDFNHRIQHIRNIVEVLHPSLVSEIGNRHRDADERLEQTNGIPPGTYVLLKRVVGVTKLTRRYQGIYKIESRTKEGNYVLISIRGRPTPTPMHPSRLRVITREVAEDLLSHPGGEESIQPDDIDDIKVFEVEAILAHRQEKVGHKTVLKYLVKWSNYPPEDNTWEPEENVANATNLLEEYWQKQHAEEVHAISEISLIRERQLQEHVEESRQWYLTEELQRWIGNLIGEVDVDVSPTQRKLSFVRCNIVHRLDERDEGFVKSKSIWFNFQWELEQEAFAWLREKAKSKLAYILIPEWLYLPQEGFTVVMAAKLPRDIKWFSYPNGNSRKQPHWNCSLVCYQILQ